MNILTIKEFFLKPFENTSVFLLKNMRFPTKSSCIHVAKGDAMTQERGGVGEFQLKLNNIFIIVLQMQSGMKKTYHGISEQREREK